MKIGILISSQLFEAYSGANRLEEAGKALGHEVIRLLERKISFEEIETKLQVKYDGKPMPEFDVIIVRPNFVEEPSLHQFIYDLLVRAGYKLVNGGPGVTRTKNKILQRHDLRGAEIPMPKWAVAYGVTSCLAAVESLGYPVIVKMAFGTKGKGVFFAENRKTLAPIVDYLNVRDGNPVIIEQFIEEASTSHVRAFVVGNEVIACCGFTASSNDVRTNASVEGEVWPTVLSEEEKNIALRVAATMGLDVAGIDLVRTKRGVLVLEVNANPGFTWEEKITGVDVAKKIVEYSLKKVS